MELGIFTIFYQVCAYVAISSKDVRILTLVQDYVPVRFIIREGVRKVQDRSVGS